MQLYMKIWTLLLCDATKSTCSLDAHLHLNEYDTDCLLYVCIFTFMIHLLTMMSGFFPSLWNRCRLQSLGQVCPDDLWDFVQLKKHWVFASCSSPVVRGLGWPTPSEYWTSEHTQQHNVTNITCMASRTPQIWAQCYDCGSESAPGFEQWGKPLIKMDGLYAKENKYSPFSVNTTEQWMHVVDSTLSEQTLTRYLFLDFNVKPKEWTAFSRPCTFEAHRNWSLLRRGRGNPLLNWIFDGCESKTQQEMDRCQRLWTFLYVVFIFFVLPIFHHLEKQNNGNSTRVMYTAKGIVWLLGK